MKGQLKHPQERRKLKEKIRLQSNQRPPNRIHPARKIAAQSLQRKIIPFQTRNLFQEVSRQFNVYFCNLKSPFSLSNLFVT